jgi:hypothetical protein
MALAFCFTLVELRPVTFLASPVPLVKIHFIIEVPLPKLKVY